MNNWHGGSAVNEHTMSEADIETLLSHQLRTPLSAIKWFTEMMLNGDIGNLSAEQRKYLEYIQDSSQHSSALVSDLLQSLATSSRPHQGAENVS